VATNVHVHKQPSRSPSPKSRQERGKSVYSETTHAVSKQTVQELPAIMNSQLKTSEMSDFAQTTTTNSHVGDQSPTSRHERCNPIYSETTDDFERKTLQERPRIIDLQVKTRETKDFAQQTTINSPLIEHSPTLRQERCKPIYSETTDAFAPRTLHEQPRIIDLHVKTRETKDFAQQTTINSHVGDQLPTSRQERCKPIYSETTNDFSTKTLQERPQVFDLELKSRGNDNFGQQSTLNLHKEDQSPSLRQERCKPIYSETTDAFSRKIVQERPEIMNSQLKTSDISAFGLQKTITSNTCIGDQSPTSRQERCKPIYSETTDDFGNKTLQERPRVIDLELKSRGTDNFDQRTTINSHIHLQDQSPTSRQERCKPIYSETTDDFGNKTLQERPRVINLELKSRGTDNFDQQTTINSHIQDQSPTSRQERCKPIYSETTNASANKALRERPRVIDLQLKSRGTDNFAQQTTISSYSCIEDQSPTSRQERRKPIYSETTDDFANKTLQERSRVIDIHLKSRATENLSQQTTINSQLMKDVRKGHELPVIYSKPKDGETKYVARQHVVGSVTSGHAVPNVIQSQSNNHVTKYVTQQPSYDFQIMQPGRKGHTASNMIHLHSKGHVVEDKSHSLYIDNFYI